MPNQDKTTLTLKIAGTKIPSPGLPRALQAARRAVDAGVESPFLPTGLIRVTAAYDVSGSARAAGAAAAEAPVGADEVLALEMPDGLTLFIRADRLREDLARIDPTALDEEGKLILDALRDRSAVSRGVFTNLVSRIFSLRLGEDAIIDEAKAQAFSWARDLVGDIAGDKLKDLAELGVTRLGTKALMWAIEKQLDREPGLYRWNGGADDAGDLQAVTRAKLAEDAKAGPLLVFIHGTASSTAGSFGKLREREARAQADWKVLTARFGERIYAFEHRTFSESPIENALQLAGALPRGAHICLVTHSRGGLVGDLLSIGGLGETQINAYQRRLIDPPLFGASRLERDLAQADEADRKGLRELRTTLQEQGLQIERYVRVACPANGTRLLSANLDVFLSGLLTLIGTVTTLAASPIYQALQRIVLEIARNRTRPELVPGIEAMLPQSALAALLARAKLHARTKLAIIAGDIEGGGLLKRLGVLLTDYALFDQQDNDLVVDTDSMYTGLARMSPAWRRFEQGPDVSHFRYFANDDSRAAMRDWLTAPDPVTVGAFDLMLGLREPSAEEEKVAFDAITRSRGGEPDGVNRPVVIVLPGVMGSHLVKGSDRVWFDPGDLAFGGLEKIRWSASTGQGEQGDRVAAEKLLSMSYGDVCEHLLSSHRVETFPYDWRQPVEAAAERLARRVEQLLDETEVTKQAVRLLAHSMGGLVVRAMIAKHKPLFERLMDREGARFIMCGTPNQGSHSMVGVLIGKDDAVRKLARLDLKDDLQEVLDIIKEFRGALQLLPKPGFQDVGVQAAAAFDYLSAATWEPFKEKMKDFWFGHGRVGLPSQAALDEAGKLWNLEGLKDARLPVRPQDSDKIIYVFGAAPNTPCGLTEQAGTLKMVGTPLGDGTVTWASGKIGGVGHFYQMPARHGDMLGAEDYFPALVDLLMRGETDKLLQGEPKLRGAAEEIVVYDAGPVPLAPAEEIMQGLLGASTRKAPKAAPASTLQVSCVAGDLRYTTLPVLVGHYEQDPISGAEKLIDSALVNGELTMRHHLGLYAGRIGSATIVLKAQTEQERLRGSFRGAVVVGLGTYGELTAGGLTESVRAATLRYLLHLVDSGIGAKGAADQPTEVKLSSLLLGYNSTTNISIEDSVAAIVRGVLAANQQFESQMKPRLKVTSLELIELYLDTAISATRAIQKVAERINRDSTARGMKVEAAAVLAQREGARQRLEALGSLSYWPRLIITDGDRKEDDGLATSGEGASESQRTALATRLRFVYLGQRARAESVLQQRQPGLVEKLVERSMKTPTYSEDFSRSLFQLLVPHDFKEAARQMERIVLVLDGYTANLPWELMLADEDKPMAVKTAMVRQFATARYRPSVRQSLQRTAYVVGNPSTEGFAKAFPDPTRKEQKDPDSLPGAENEANTVVGLLRQNDYAVTESIGADQTALEVINRLYRQPYRIVHIAAHGVYDIAAADGTKRSGVVLSDGLVISAVEISAMEMVPDLVFLNCCHLGKVDRSPVAFNRLAYSVARELIEIGVRAVVVAGWAVDDSAANLFAETFYGELFKKVPFGLAVFEARKAAYDKYSANNTWGAYQAYGDPGFVIDPQANSSGYSEDFKLVSPEELLDLLRGTRVRITSSGAVMTSKEAKERSGELAKILRRGAEFAARPEVQSELGRYYSELGGDYFGRARDHYMAAIQADDKQGRVPIRAIEQLANLEARYGEATLNRDLVDSALSRLFRLRGLSGQSTRGGTLGEELLAPAAEGEHVERAALIGSAYKRKAGLHAREILGGKQIPSDAGAAFEAALSAGVAWYRSAEGKADGAHFRPYLALNRLGLQAVREFTDRGSARAGEGIALAQECARKAREGYAKEPDYWNGVIPADAYLTQTLLDHSLGLAGEGGKRVYDQILRTYGEALSNLQRTQRELDSTARHVCLLSLFYRAQAMRLTTRKEEAMRIAERLKSLARELMPNSCEGAEFGAGEGATPAPGKARAKRKAGTRKARVSPAGGRRAAKRKRRKPKS